MAAYIARPVPFRLVRAAAFLAVRDALSHWQVDRSGGPGEDPYAVGPTTLRFLRERVLASKPSYVLEFGSGRSTVALAAAMRDLHGDGTRVFSIDENDRYLGATEAGLAQAGVCAHLAARPLKASVVHGVTSLCYDTGDGFWDDFLSGVKPDLVFVDGPSGNGMARLATIPSARDHLASGCVVLLDDALRQDEMDVVRCWQRHGIVRVIGVHLVGHGVLEAHL